MSRTLEQERAAFAWEKTERCDAEFKSRISGTTALIMENGLMQALAYYKEKKHDRVWQPIAEWLARQLDLPDLLRGANAEQLFCGVMKKLQDAEADQLLFATEEALAIAEWLRRWAKARA